MSQIVWCDTHGQQRQVDACYANCPGAKKCPALKAIIRDVTGEKFQGVNITEGRLK